MQKIAFILACLASFGHGRVNQAFNPTPASTLSAKGAPALTTSKKLLSRHAPTMNINEATQDFGPVDRRAAIGGLASLLSLALTPQEAKASGGATAGRFVTVPSAKRQYYGRVQQGVYEYLNMGDAIKKGDWEDESFNKFYGKLYKSKPPKIIRDEATCQQIKNEDNRAKCYGKIKYKYQSRFDDLKQVGFLLGNAFRDDSSQDPPNVKECAQWLSTERQMIRLRNAINKQDKREAILAYSASIDALNNYLEDVELPPVNYDLYASPADLTVPVVCQGSFCN
mmetsp:Transcript_152293/g.277088  ORF Transcript_152293/g.277088 Transcript_152293/m.277088 type:complete len:282 (-) Transcript_152293:189-1034(-)